MATHPRRWQEVGISAAWQRTILFFAGLTLLGHEALLRSEEARWPLLVIYAGMMGLPFTFQADAVHRLKQLQQPELPPAPEEP